MLSTLRSIDQQALALGSSCAQLRQLGYVIQDNALVTARLYLRFAAHFEDGAEIMGCIDIACWLTQTLPEIVGIDWLSLDERLLPALIAGFPLQLEFDRQHAPLKQCQVIELVRSSEALRCLPGLPTSSGVVLVEKFKCGIGGERSDPKHLSGLQIPLLFCLGTSKFPLRSLGVIQAGDVLLIDRPSGKVCSNNETLFQFKLDQESLMILEPNDEPEGLDSDTADLANHDSTVKDPQNKFDNLPVQLSFILMEKSVTLAELKAMIPGETITISADAIMNVEIRVNQHKFARGELVQLTDGSLAVEIRQISSKEI